MQVQLLGETVSNEQGAVHEGGDGEERGGGEREWKVGRMRVWRRMEDVDSERRGGEGLEESVLAGGSPR